MTPFHEHMLEAIKKLKSPLESDEVIEILMRIHVGGKLAALEDFQALRSFTDLDKESSE